jgi:predicted esterase
MARSSALCAALASALTLWIGGCGSESDTPDDGAPGPEDPASAIALLGRTCDDALDAIGDAADAPSPFTAETRGALARCAYDRFVPADEMRAHYAEIGLPDPGVTTGAHKLRLSYFIERASGEPGLTSASIYLPAARIADPAPLVVAGHGSVGLADACAPSREEANGFHRDWRSQLYAFAGAGWVVIQPDFPGLGTPGATSWMSAPDEGHAMLDATRAARALLRPGFFSSHNAIVGHSNGGHAALSAQALAKSYGAEGTIDAVVAYAPFWLSNAAWGALLTPLGASYADDVFYSMTMQYFYGHLDAYEGDEHATDAFLAEHADDARAFLEGACWSDITGKEAGPSSQGWKKAADLFRPEYTATVGGCGLSGTCDDPLAATWKERWVADRPPPDPAIPIVIWQGALDDFLVPGFQKCAIDRLEGQGADLQVCVDEAGTHSSIVTADAAWVRDYFASLALGADGPAPCAGIEALGEDLSCSMPIANSVEPTEP